MYEIKIKPSALKEFKKLSDDIKGQIRSKVEQLREEPRHSGVSKLTGRNDVYRMRAGIYRVLFQVDADEHIVRILSVRKRNKAYK